MKNKYGLAAGMAAIACVTLAVLGQDQSSSIRTSRSTPPDGRAAKASGPMNTNRTGSKLTSQSSGAAQAEPEGLILRPASTGSSSRATQSGNAAPNARTVRTAGVPAEELRKELPPVIPETRDADAKGLPVGPQNPSLNISWIGPVGINVGEEATCEIAIRNLSQTLARDVVVQATIPNGVRFIGAEPAPFQQDASIAWSLGDIEPRTERRIQVRLIPDEKGTVTAMATVTFSSMTCANIRVEEPKLDLAIQAPPEVILGDPLTFALVVENPGSSATSGVTIATLLPDGLVNPNGVDVEYEVGNLEPNESRAVQVSVTAAKPGQQRIRAIASSGATLKSNAEAIVNVIQPQLALKSSGPALRYLEREATYTLTATNPGTAMASNVRLVATIPTGFQFVAAAEGGKHEWTSRTVSWFLGQLPPGGSRDVQLTLMAIEPGKQTIHANAVAERDLKANAETVTQVEGIAALLMEVVDIDDPVEQGRETAYQIRVTNQGSKTANNVQIVAEVPDEMEVIDAKGPVHFQVNGQKIVFEPLPKLASKADAIYRVKVKGKIEGDVRFRARLTCDALRSPVIEEESTKIYED